MGEFCWFFITIKIFLINFYSFLFFKIFHSKWVIHLHFTLIWRTQLRICWPYQLFCVISFQIIFYWGFSCLTALILQNLLILTRIISNILFTCWIIFLRACIFCILHHMLIHKNLFNFKCNFLLLFLFHLIHISRNWIYYIISIHIYCKSTLFNLSKVGNFKWIPTIWFRLMSHSFLIFFSHDE